jgi:hypothetical protein
MTAGLAHASGVPYYAQWESADLVPQFLDGSLSPADDPRWAASGARTRQDYAFWSTRICGLACLKMILAWRALPVPPTMRLVERALEWKAYIPDGSRVTGLIYRPFADWIRHDYGIVAEVAASLPVETVVAKAAPGTPVIASVHGWIRWPDRTPPERGGHLVLVTGTSDGLVRLHNPSGIPGHTQRDALLTQRQFARFYAGRGLLVHGRQLDSSNPS